jgi:hypothetical protein
METIYFPETSDRPSNYTPYNPEDSTLQVLIYLTRHHYVNLELKCKSSE